MTRKWRMGVLMLLTGIAMIVVSGSFARTGGALAGSASGDITNPDRVIRLHVIANSDSDEDQALKRAVRDALLEEITPVFVNAKDTNEAAALVEQYLPRLEQVAFETLAAQGVYYPVHAELGRFDFPGKAYGDTYLPAGEYRALRVTLGKAEGANWWCIFYPPLCLWHWRVGIVEEPKPGTDGRETVTMVREEPAELIDEDELADVEVRPQFALLEWARNLAGGESEE